MKFVRLAILLSLDSLVPRTDAGARQPPPWTLPRDREVYLMEDDLVYARFLTLERGGTYRQINRDEHGSLEVDRGRWEQDAAGMVQLHSTCRALRPRAVVSGPLSISLTGERAFDDLPRQLAAVQRFLATDQDAVFDAKAMTELNTAGSPAVQIDRGAVAFDRRDADALVTRIETALATERSATYLLEPVKSGSRALFVLPGGTFGAADLAGVCRTYHVADGAIPPFYFARVEAKTYAAEVGRWQPLRVPGGGE